MRRFAARHSYLTYLFQRRLRRAASDIEGARLNLFTNNWFRADEKRRFLDTLMSSVKEHFPRLTTSEEIVRGWPESAPDLNPRTILGIATTHETGACILQDGEVTAAINEERLSRLKLDTTYPPTRSIAEAIRLADIAPDEITPRHRGAALDRPRPQILTHQRAVAGITDGPTTSLTLPMSYGSSTVARDAVQAGAASSKRILHPPKSGTSSITRRMPLRHRTASPPTPSW